MWNYHSHDTRTSEYIHAFIHALRRLSYSHDTRTSEYIHFAYRKHWQAKPRMTHAPANIFTY